MATALVLSGGTGTRMGFDGFPKQYVMVAGKSVLMYALQGFANVASIEDIVIVAAPEWRSQIEAWVQDLALPKGVRFADPGTTRQGSIRNGLRVVADCPPSDDVVVIHDAARPNLTSDMIDSYIANIGDHDGLMPALPMKDTVYMSEDGSSVSSLLDRDRLFAGQAPEVFRFARYLEVNEAATDTEIEITRGTSEIAFRNGLSIRIVEGSEENYKITTRDDLRRFCEQAGADYEECLAAVERGR